MENISEDIMRRNADLGEHGNMDGGEIDLPSNVATIFDVENVNTTTEFNEDELLSAIEAINVERNDTVNNAQTSTTSVIDGQLSPENKCRREKEVL